MTSPTLSQSASWTARVGLVLVLAGFLLVVWRLLDLRFQAGKGLPPYSLYSEQDDGLAEAAHVLRKLGWEPVPLTRPAVVGLQQGLLLCVGPETDEFGAADVRVLLHWVEAGNTLLFASTHQTALHQALDLHLVRPRALEEDPLDVDPEAFSPYTDGIARLTIDFRATVQGPASLPLWYVGDRPGAVVLRRGEGHILVLADPGLLTNHGLRQGDNVLLLSNIARLHGRDGQVYFDEYHHGLRSSGGFWGYLGYHREQLTLVPIAVVLGAGLWRALVRLGPAVPRPAETRADAVDYASALGRLYEQTGSRRLLGRALARGFLATLTRVLRLRRNALPAEVLAAWRQKDAGQLERLQRLLRGLAELRKPDLTDRQLLAWTRAFDQFQREVLDGG
jgi:hypothetical protein